jgi:hypothetical protein
MPPTGCRCQPERRRRCGRNGRFLAGGRRVRLMYEYALTPSLSLSFQRYPYPPDGVVTALPRSGVPYLFSSAGRSNSSCPAPPVRHSGSGSSRRLTGGGTG